MAVVSTVPLTWEDRPTLGWEIIHWMESNLIQPDGPDAGTPFRLTGEQMRFVLRFYEIDRGGLFNYRRATFRRSKGHGKSPFLAALALVEFLGPCRFGGWDADGEPLVIPHPMPDVRLAGYSLPQTRNTMSIVIAMLGNPETSPLVLEHNLDIGLTRILAPRTNGLLMPVASGSKTLEGARPSAVIADETHHWTTPAGHELAEVLRRGLAKARDGSARMVETTNAHEPGMGSVGEKTFEAWQKQKAALVEGKIKHLTILYDSRETDLASMADRAELIEGLKEAYGDSDWVNWDTLADEIYDPSSRPEVSRRFYLNQIVASSRSWVSPIEWASNHDPDLAPLAQGEGITIGFDGSRTSDSTVIVACRVSDGTPWVLGLWEHPPNTTAWEVDSDDVRNTMDWVFANYDVQAAAMDYAYWEPDVDNWRDTYGEGLLVKASSGHAMAFDMRTHQRDSVIAAQSLHSAIVHCEFPHSGDPRLTIHMGNTRIRTSKWGEHFGKESRDSMRKVDLVTGVMLARIALARLRASGATRRRSRRVLAF